MYEAPKQIPKPAKKSELLCRRCNNGLGKMVDYQIDGNRIQCREHKHLLGFVNEPQILNFKYKNDKNKKLK